MLSSSVIIIIIFSLICSSFYNVYTYDQVFNIGAVLSTGNNIVLFLEQIEKGKLMLPAGSDLIGNTVPVSINPIRTAQDVCDNLISRQVFAVIVSHSKSGETSPASVSFTCGFYNIPVIGISNRDSSLSNKNLHSSFMRTVAPYFHQADVWIEMLKVLNYNRVVFIHSRDNNGRSTLGRFQNLADKEKIKIEMIIEYDPLLTNLYNDLNSVRNDLSCRVYILYSSKSDSEKIFTQIKKLSMLTEGYVWLVTEQALDASNRPDGIIGPILRDSTNETAHIQDSVNIIIMALRSLYLHDDNITKPPNDCGKQGDKWLTGTKFLSYLRNQTLPNGATGRLSFDDNMDRLESDYDIVNIVNGNVNIIGKYGYSTKEKGMILDLNIDSIVWPGGLRTKPSGYFVLTHLKIVTIAEKPFIWKKLPQTISKSGLSSKSSTSSTSSSTFPKSVTSDTSLSSTSICTSSQIKCPHIDPNTGIETIYCCEGYCIDLLKQLSSKIKFTYDLYLVPDGMYGEPYFTSNGTKLWNGLVGELVYKKADMIIAPLTINPERAKVMEFSKPFKYQGIAMLQKRIPKGAKLDSFLQPFQNTLWLLVLLSVNVVALVLYLLDRFSPFGKFKLSSPANISLSTIYNKKSPGDDSIVDDEKALNFSSAIWFAWGVLLNSGVGEKTPRSFSARVLGMVWAGFAMIVVASYTANLAAFLVLDSTETEITGLEDSRLRNPVEGFKYATVKGSSVDMYFRGQVELSNMYRLMEEINRPTAEEAIEAVKKGELNVFFWDSPRLEYEAAYDCQLFISAEPFGRSGYGIGLQRNSFWTENVTLQLLSMHESGFMEGLDNKWILKGEKECENKEANFPTTLGLKNIAGVFMLVGAGIVVGIGLIWIEIVYKRHRAKKIRQVTSAKKAAQKWRTIVKKRKQMKNPLSGSTPITPLPPLPFKRSSQNIFTVTDCRKEMFPYKFSLPYTLDRDIVKTATFQQQQQQKQQIAQQLHQRQRQYYPYYATYNNNINNNTRVSMVSNSLNPLSINNYQRQIEADIDIPPPPPPPPSASPRIRSPYPVIYCPRKSKGVFISV